MSDFDLRTSRALWNRSALDLRSSEVIAQLLEHGEIEAWRELYRLARSDAALRQRIRSVVERVPLSFGHLWLAALASLGEAVDLGTPLPPFRLDV